MNIKKYNKTTYLSLGIGFVLFLIGIVKYFFTPTDTAINLRTLLPTVSDGSLPLIVGVGGLIIGVYRLVYREKIIKKHSEWKKKQEKKDEKKNRLTGIR